MAARGQKNFQMSKEPKSQKTPQPWFMDDLRSRLTNRVQLTSDGHKAYLEAVEGVFGGDIDYAQLVKIYVH